jgi:hypothetical protein
MKTVTLYSFDDRANEFAVVGTISYDGEKLTGDSETARSVLHWPLIAYDGGREITADTPLEFLRGLNAHYKNVYLSASPVKET